MSDWISSWIGGKASEEEEDQKTQNDHHSQEETGEKCSPNAPAPSKESLREKRLRMFQAQQERQTNDQPPVVPAAAQQVESKTAPVAASIDPKKVKPKVKKNPINEMLKRILQFTITANDLDIDRKGFPFLTNFEHENDADGGDEEGNVRMLTQSNVEAALYSYLSSTGKITRTSGAATTFEYLMEVYSRCLSQSNDISIAYGTKLSEETKKSMKECINSVQELAVNYSCIALTIPEMFPSDLDDVNLTFFSSVIRQNSSILPTGYLEKIVKGLEPEQLTQVFTPIFQIVVSELLQLKPASVFADFFTNISVVIFLCRIKPLAKVFVHINGFLLVPGMPLTGYSVQEATALGIMLRFGTTDSKDPMIKQMFSNLTRRTRQEVDMSVKSLQTKLSMLIDLVTDLFRCLLKSGPECKSKTIQWIIQVVDANVEREKENPDMRIASSNDFFLNFSCVLLRLCGPILEFNSSKSNLINLDFFMSNTSIFPNDCTKLVGLEEEKSAVGQEGDSTGFNFITQIFFLTLRALHLGPVFIIRQYMRMMQQLSYLQNHMSDGDERMRMHFELLASQKMTIDAGILHPILINDMARFALLSCEVLCRVCCPNKELVLPLPSLDSIDHKSKNSLLLAKLPEHMLEDVTSVLIFVARLSAKSLTGFPLDNLLQVIVMFLSSPKYVHSPHLRAKLSEVLLELFLPSKNEASTFRNNSDDDDMDMIDEDDGDGGRVTAGLPQGQILLESNVLAQQHLSSCLLALYGDVEATGYYEKLEHRYNIACLLKYLWHIPEHRRSFVMISQDQTRFVRFSNGLMNHINGLVTDALTALPEIRQLQEEKFKWLNLNETQREEKESLLQEKERTATSSLQLANETIHMMSYLTSEIKESFLLDELIDRLATMLNSVLTKLAGPRGLELKVLNPEQYKFRPKIMLQEVTQTMLHLAGYEKFQRAVANNGFYDGNIFTKCLNILRRIQLLSTSDLVKFEQFIHAVAKVSNEERDDEEALGEIPDHFLDPLMCTLMKDPVTLSTSGYVVDRATINQHLLNDPTDPFNRQPLTQDNIQPNDLLKQEIIQWLATKRNS